MCARHMAIIIIVVLAALLGAVSLAYAARPENFDPTLGPWFNSLHDARGRSCCGMGDGHRVDYRIGQSGYQALYDGEWRDVPNSIVVRTANPVGEALLFVSAADNRTMYCFIPAAEI